MGSKKSRRRSFSKDFILGVLRDYYSTDSSKNFGSSEKWSDR